MHEINPYNILAVPEKHLEIGLRKSHQRTIKPTGEPYDLWNMSLPSLGLQPNLIIYITTMERKQEREDQY